MMQEISDPPIWLGGTNGFLDHFACFDCDDVRGIFMFRRLYALLLVALIAASIACSSTVVPPANVQIKRSTKDELGRTVELPERVSRIVSLAPNVTELIFAAGGGDRLVGVTTYCNFPAEAAAIDKVGDTMTPNLESIIALKPDVVIVSTASQVEALVDKLGANSIQVFVLAADDFERIGNTIRSLGDLFDTRDTADRVASALSERLAKLKQANSGFEPLKAFVQISNEPLFTIGKDSYLTNALTATGAVSVTADLPTAYPRMSKESAVKLDPDVIILSAGDDNSEPNAAFARSQAVKNRRIIKIDADLLSRPGPRLIDGLEQISCELRVAAAAK